MPSRTAKVCAEVLAGDSQQNSCQATATRTCTATSRATSHTAYPHATVVAVTERPTLRGGDTSVGAGHGTRSTHCGIVQRSYIESVAATVSPDVSQPLSR